MLRRASLVAVVIAALVCAAVGLFSSSSRPGLPEASGGLLDLPGSQPAGHALDESPRPSGPVVSTLSVPATSPPDPLPRAVARVTGRILVAGGVSPPANAFIDAWLAAELVEPVTAVLHGDAGAPVVSVAAGPDGRYSVELAVGTWFLVGRGAGYRPGSAGIRPAAGVDLAAPVIVLSRQLSFVLHLRDEDGRPVTQASVGEFPVDECTGPCLARTAADADGVVRGEAGEGHSLLVAARGFAVVVLDVPRSADPRVVELRPGFEFGGRVVDIHDTPIGGASVRSLGPIERSMTTGADGRFRFSGLDPSERGVGCVNAFAPGFAAGEVEGALGALDARLVLRRPARVSGVVRFPDGRPAADVPVGRQRTDALGAFALAEVPSGDGAIEVSVRVPEESNFWSGVAPYSVPEAGHVEGVVVTLNWHGGPFEEPSSSARAAVAVRVTDSDGAPVAGARLSGPFVGTGPPPPTDDAGRTLALFRAQPGARFEIRAFAPAQPGVPPDLFGCRREVITGDPSRPPEAAFVFPRAVECTIVVQDHGGAPVGADVQVLWSVSGAVGVSCRAPGPRLRVRLAVGCPHDLSASIAGWSPVQVRGWVPPRSGGEVALRLGAGATILARVEQSTLAPGGVYVEIVRLPEPSSPTAIGADWHDWAHAGGIFAVHGVPPGRYWARFGCGPGRFNAGRAFEVRSSETLDLGTIRLEWCAELAGRARDSAGSPVAGAWIEPEFGPGLGALGTTTLADGSFRLRLPPVHGRLIASKRGFGTVSTTLDPTHRTAITLTLPKPGALRLEDPARTAEWQIQVAYPDDPHPWVPPGLSRTAAGVQLIRDLAPGDITIRLHRGQRSLLVPATVIEGQETSVQLPVLGD